jgi:hypothetical protein
VLDLAEEPGPEREIGGITVERSLDLPATGVAYSQVVGDWEQIYGR